MCNSLFILQDQANEQQICQKRRHFILLKRGNKRSENLFVQRNFCEVIWLLFNSRSDRTKSTQQTIMMLHNQVHFRWFLLSLFHKSSPTQLMVTSGPILSAASTSAMRVLLLQRVQKVNLFRYFNFYVLPLLLLLLLIQ